MSSNYPSIFSTRLRLNSGLRGCAAASAYPSCHRAKAKSHRVKKKIKQSSSCCRSEIFRPSLAALCSLQSVHWYRRGMSVLCEVTKGTGTFSQVLKQHHLLLKVSMVHSWAGGGKKIGGSCKQRAKCVTVKSRDTLSLTKAILKWHKWGCLL